ncbi:hypothetical protein ACFOY5_20770 [Massilia aurea]|uniref:hypothetical protein n=1 Tax=Massilia aurea TaxID=373040 RepID=UPI002163FEF4|nr:hypothetical protein [Massilia aurea]MCS0710020.1 hypothetical protein [Massilia aurea]
MTPKHPYTNCPALPLAAVGGVFWFSFSQSLLGATGPVGRGFQAVAKKIHNMNAFNSSKEAGVHIMNFLTADQKQSRAIHIMNFINSQVEPPSVRLKLNGAGVTGAPSTNKGARNVMS